MSNKTLLFTFLLSVIFAGCARSGAKSITLLRGQAQRIDDCNLMLDFAPVSPSGVPFADMRFVCGAPESALKEKEWWGNQAEPLAFNMTLGDCLPLQTTYYCIEAIEPGSSATLKATYQKPRRPEYMLKRLP